MPLHRTRSDGQAFKPGRRDDRSNASTQRSGYSATSLRKPLRLAPRNSFLFSCIPNSIAASCFSVLSLDSRLVTTVVSKPQMDYRKIVNAAGALEKQIERYRQMTGEQRLAIALELHELSCDVAREGIRRANPGADTAEVERLLHRRLELARAR